MVALSGPFILQRFFTLGPLKRAWNGSDDFFKTMAIILSIGVLIFLGIMTVVDENGQANCEKNYGKSYSYDGNASGQNAAKKCVNKTTHERKPIVVEK